MLINYKYNKILEKNMYTLAYKKSNNGSSSNNISSFKIQGNSLTSMYITPVEDCVVDFGDGTKQTYIGNNRSTQVTHNYSESNIYTIKIIGNHSNFRASANTIEAIQLANSVTNCTDMFRECYNLTTIPSTFTISNSVTDCSRMFSYCTNLTAIPSTLRIPDSVTNCSEMFYYCSKITEIPSTLRIPDSVTDCSGMFDECSSLTAIPETLIIPNSVTNCSSMFADCEKITEIPSTLTIPNSVTNCSLMFYECSNLTTISEGFTIPNSVTDCSQMFSYCSSLTTIPSTLTIPDSVTECSSMFSRCPSLISDISNIWPSTWNSTGINMTAMFSYSSKIVGTVPADKLWNSGKRFISSGCFFSCTLLYNYDEIPSEWKEFI